MRMARIVQVISSGVLVVSICWAGWQLNRDDSVLAEHQATIIITQPDGVDDVVGEGDDFATTVFGDPWDMSEYTDIPALHGIPGGTISNGMLNYTIPSNPYTHIPLLHPGAEGAIDAGIKVGSNYPINTDHYHWLSFRMNQPGGFFTVRWFYGKDISACSNSTTDIPISPGWHTYVIDLETAPKSMGSWHGQIMGLFVMISGAVGDTGSIDWARLTTDNPAGNSLDISWFGLSPADSTIEFYLDSDDTSCNGTLIYAESNAPENGSFIWQRANQGIASPTNVAPGDYYVCARVNGSEAGYSLGQLTVNHAPIVHFTQPSFTSGEDYATAAGNPWDMDDMGDVDHVVNGSYTIDNGVLAVTASARQSDVQVYLNLPTAIDRYSYYYLTYRLWFDYPYTWSDVGQGTRVFWGRAPQTETQSGWIYDYPGWQTCKMDLRSLSLSFGPGWDTADWTIFRIDPIANNTGQQVTVYLDDIKLTGDEKADTFTNVKWQLTDPDSPVTTMTLYYDDDQSGLDGLYVTTLTLTDGEQSNVPTTAVDSSPSLYMTTTLTETIYLPLVAYNYVVPCTGACYTWQTDNIPVGVYYLYACVDDDYNELCRYSETPLRISHP